VDDRLGRYVLVEHIATGGMGEIWLALDPEAGRIVAIKRLRPELANTADVREMFDDEARLSARLDHPGIVRVHSFEVIEKERLIVMEYILGVSTKLLLDSAAMRHLQVPPGAALRIVSQAARALHYAHELTDDAGRPMNLVHRDITPHNLLVSLEGEVKIVDFGIAKASTRIHQTQHGMIKGKTSYMSPEQCTGLELDRRTDVFSLGIVLYELITGHRLFQRANDIDSLMAIISAPIPSPSALNPSISKNLERIILRGVERDLEQRWPTAAALAEALEGEQRSLASDGAAELRRTVAALCDPEIRQAGKKLARAVSTVTPPQGVRLIAAVEDVTRQLDALGSQTEPEMRIITPAAAVAVQILPDRTPPPMVPLPSTPRAPRPSAPSSRPMAWLLAGAALLMAAAVVALLRAPPPAEQANERGARFLREGNLASAEDEFMHCVDVEPTRAECYRSLGVVLTARGKNQDAIISYKNFLALAPRSPEAAEVRAALRALESGGVPKE